MPPKDCKNCAEHSAHETKLEDINKLWDVVQDKTPIWAFLLLVTLVVGGLGLQWKTYDAIKNVEIEVAVIKVKIEESNK